MQPTGGVQQMSVGVGASRNAALSARRGWLAFESTSAPVDGSDTGIEQIRPGTVDGIASAPITDGLAPSMHPSFSADGAILTFQSRANLAGDKSDMGVPAGFSLRHQVEDLGAAHVRSGRLHRAGRHQGEA